jgi:hypothetical protein
MQNEISERSVQNIDIDEQFSQECRYIMKLHLAVTVGVLLDLQKLKSCFLGGYS